LKIFETEKKGNPAPGFEITPAQTRVLT